MRNITKGLMGAFAAISVAATAPAYAGLPTIAPAQGHGLFKADQDAGFYRKKRHHRNYSRDQRVHSNTRIWRGNDGRHRCKKDNGTTGLLHSRAGGGPPGHEPARP